MIPWLRSNYMVEEPATISMNVGKLDINEKELIANELKLPKPVRYEVYLTSKRLKIAGIIDIVAGSKRLIIVEAKKFKRKWFKHFEIQLKFYAYLATKELAPVTTAILKLNNNVVKYQIESEDLRIIEELVKKVREVKNSPRPPTTNSDGSKCSICWYRRYCIRATL